MIYLSGCVWPIREMETRRWDLGVMLAYPHKENFGLLTTFLQEAPWAMDNGCFSAKSPFDLEKYVGCLTRHSVMAHRCLFAVAPDVVGDPIATSELSKPVLPVIRSAGYKAAYVAQDGLRSEDVEWDSFDVFFVGGSTEYKLSDQAMKIAGEAKKRGKWLHMGRVNSYKRLRFAADNGFDSSDGTCIAFGPSIKLPKFIKWLDIINGIHG